jgi:DUF1680 family protein
VWVHLYHSSDLSWHLPNGTGLKVQQQTDYPWQDTIELTVRPELATDFSLFLRVPSWSTQTSVQVNGQSANVQPKPGNYMELRRRWAPGDRVRVRLDMQPRLTTANPLVRENVGRVAVERGPLVYCLEQKDQAAGKALFDLSLASGAFESEFKPKLLGGVLVLRHPGRAAARPLNTQPLYSPVNARTADASSPVTLTFIPYYAWANREPQPMVVWVPRASDARK